ncbi:MAG: hypothetical protein ABIU95_02015 [Burkholderiales bacterium]
MNTSTTSNENWGTCPGCGEPVLINPSTGKMEPCAACASRKSPGVAMGTMLLIAGIAIVVGLVYFCIRVLL